MIFVNTTLSVFSSVARSKTLRPLPAYKLLFNSKMSKAHYFLFCAVPTITDYRYLFDITRISRAITKINPHTTLDELHIYCSFDSFWKVMFEAATATVSQHCDSTCVEEITFEEVASKMRYSDICNTLFTLTGIHHRLVMI